MPDSGILHYFTSLSDGFQKQVGTLAAGGFLTGAGFLLRQLWIWIKSLLEAKSQAKQSSPGFLAQKTIDLNVAADRACSWSGADHASIYLLSNGQYAANGDSIQKLSMVGEGAQMTSQRRWMSESQNLPTSLFPSVMMAAEQGSKLWLYQDESEDYQLNQYMRTRGYTCRLVLPLFGARKSLIGLLCLSWNEGRFSDEMLPNLTDLENHRRHCAAILAQS